MTSCKTILSGSSQIKSRFLSVDPGEGPLCFQIASSDVNETALACDTINQLPVSIIDINAGCPVKKIRQRKQGSSLLAAPDLLSNLIKTMKNSTDRCVSVKIRVDGTSDDRYNDRVIKALQDASPDFVVIHGRNYRDGYDIPCNLPQIKHFVKELGLPVIGNGDANTPDSVRHFLNIGCEGVMISRASVGAPWLIQNIQKGLGITDNDFKPHTELCWEIFLEHINRLAMIQDERFALNNAYGLIKYYTKGWPQKEDLLQKVRQAKTLEQLESSGNF
tara:strand:+ start:12486 stop:13313 length:828 start_codon:yes stop_codon:yes gene_type:complete